MDIQGKITDPAVVKELWGDEFVELCNHRKVTFTEDAIYVQLKQPVTSISGEKTDVVKISEPTVGELKVMDSVKGDMSKSAAFVETIVGITTADTNKMKAGDFILISKIVGCFLLDGQETT